MGLKFTYLKVTLIVKYACLLFLFFKQCPDDDCKFIRLHVK